MEPRRRGALRRLWSIPDVADPVQRREVRLLFGVARPQAVIYLVSAPLFLVPGISPEASAAPSAVLMVAGAFTFAAALALAHRGRIVVAGWLAIGTALVTQMAAIAMIGGLRGVLAGSLVLSVLIAGVLRGVRAATVTGLVSVVFVALLATLEARGMAPFILAALFPGAAVVSIVAILGIAVALLAIYAKELEVAAEATRESAAQALAAEQRLADLVREAPDGFALLDLEGRIIEANAALIQMSGFGEEEIVGKKLLDLPGIPTGHARQVLEAGFAATIQDGVGGVQVELLRSDGAPLVIETRGRLVNRPGESPRVQYVVRDATERVLAERAKARLEADLRDARRMETVGRLAGGIAHDFRNLLTPILGNAGLIAGDPAMAREDAAELAREIQEAGRKASDLTGQLLSFARRQMVEVRNLGLDEVLCSIEPILRRLIREDIQLEWRLARDLPAVRADRTQLEQVVVNLVANARDAMPRGGRITVSTAASEVTPAEAASHPGARPGRHVLLSVQDTGVGMTAEVRAQVFDPFFTTKELGSGVGLGLATVHGIVSQMGGHIRVESEPGRGTAFRVFLPAAAGPADPLTTAPPAPRTLTRRALALVVDDSPGPRAVVARVLRAQGMEVLEAGDGHQAIAAAKGLPRPLDLLVSDVVMPEMPGPVLAERIRAHHPGLRVLLVSGYADPALVDAARLPPGDRFLAKPFTPDQLLARVGEVLGG